jgi:hypothetical protein
MKFSGQKFFILLGFFLVPILFVGALLREPIVNRGLLRITMNIMKQRLGTSIKARTWKVDLSRFAVAIEGIEFEENKTKVFVDEFRAEFSPVFLLIGRVYLSRVWLNHVTLGGNLSFSKNLNSNNEFILENELKDLGESLVNAQSLLEKQKIGFDLLEISSFKIQSRQVNIADADLKIENYGKGHIKFEFVVEGLSGESFPNINRLFSSFVFYKDRKSAYLSIRRLSAELMNKKNLHTSFDLKGRLPGDLSLEVVSDLGELNKWLLAQANPKFNKWARANKMNGFVEVLTTGRFSGSSFQKGESSIRSKNLQFNDLTFAELSGDFGFDQKSWSILKANGRFKSTPFDLKAKNSFSAKDIQVENGKIRGNLQLDQLGLCALLRGVNIPECYLDLVMNGNIDLEGGVDPVKITPRVSLKFEPYTVYSEPDIGKGPQGRLLKTKVSELNGIFELREKNLDFNDLNLSFGNETIFNVQGNLKYSPTRLFLKVNNESGKFEDIITDFLNQSVSGLLKTQATIEYDFQRSRENGKTDVYADYLMKGLLVSDLPFGDLSGKLQYAKNILDFKPIARMGPGTLSVAGKIGRLDPSSLESMMSLHLKSNDYELLVPRKNTTPIFDAVSNFEAHIEGSLEKETKQPFGGFLNANLHSVSSFGIPFEKGTLKAYLDLNGLRIEKLDVFKGEKKATLNGFLGEKKSHVEFSSQDFPIRQIGYRPDVERLFNGGDVLTYGWWDQEKGWSLEAVCKQAKIGPSIFPDLKLSFASRRSTHSVKHEDYELSLVAGREMNIRYDSSSENLRASLKDEGILLALSLANKKENISDFLKTKGSFDVEWAPSSGKIKLNALDFQMSDRWSKEDRRILFLEKPSEITFKNSRFLGEASFVSGQKRFELNSQGSELRASGNVSVRLLDLFLPKVIRLVDGSVMLQSRWNPLSQQGVQASLSLSDVSLYLSFLGTELRSVKGNVGVNGSELKLSNLSGRSGEGTFELNGSMGMLGGGINLKSHTSVLPLRISPDLDLAVSGDFELKGKEQPYLLSGKARVEKGLLRKEFSEAALKMTILEKPWLIFDLPFELAQGFQIKNSLTDSFVTGQGQFLGNNLVPQVSGKFNVIKGTLLAKDNEFSLLFAKVDIPRDPNLDNLKVNVQASTLKNFQGVDYRIFMSADGDPANLKLNFRSEPSLGQKEVIALLSLGYIPKDQTLNGSNQGSSIAQGASAEAFQLLFGQALGKGIQKQTGFDVRVGTSSNLKQVDTIPKVTVYRKLNERMNATFGKSLDVSRPENNFKIDYKLMKNLNLTGVWENPEENQNSLGLDLRLEFEIK